MIKPGLPLLRRGNEGEAVNSWVVCEGEEGEEDEKVKTR